MPVGGRELKKQTRRYAKRQLTWFLRDEEIKWFDIDTVESFEELENLAIDYAEKELKVMRILTV